MREPTKILKTAVDAILSGINDQKLDPHSAVVKTAKDMSLNVNMIKRASEVINTALTYNHFKKHPDARDMDFPIVDASKVAAEIFTTPEKTASQKKSDWFDHTDTNIPDFNKYRNDPSFKAAHAKLTDCHKNQPKQQMSFKGVCEKAAAVISDMERGINDLRTDFVGVQTEVNSTFADLVGCWKKEASQRTSFDEFEAQVYSTFGDRAIPYLDLIYKSANIKDDRGEHDSKYVIFDTCKEVTKFASLMAAVDKLNEKTNTLSNKTAEYISAKTELNKAYKEYGQAMNNPVDNTPEVKVAETKEVTEDLDVELDPIQKRAQEKRAALMQSDITLDPQDEAKYLTYRQRNFLPANVKAKIISSRKKTAEELQKGAEGFLTSIKDTLQDQYSSESAPDSSVPSTGALSNLDRKLLLQNLIVTDPILKSYPPKDVGSAYEQFLRIAPELSLEKEIVRSHLRQMVASQAMTAFDGGQLMDANTKLMTQKMLAEGMLKPKAKV